MFVALLILLMLAVQLLPDPAYIEELQDLMENQVDVFEVEHIRDDDDMTRRDKLKKIHRILLRKPRSLKAQYQARMQVRMMMHDEFIQAKIYRTEDPEIRNFWWGIHRLDTNWSLSEAEAAEIEFQLHRYDMNRHFSWNDAQRCESACACFAEALLAHIFAFGHAVSPVGQSNFGETSSERSGGTNVAAAGNASPAVALAKCLLDLLQNNENL